MRLSFAILLAGLGCGAVQAAETGNGAAEFAASCAACHGMGGVGDGALAAELKRRPSDLTRLAEKNGGTFPYWQIFATIDGRYLVAGHGERDMPVWGQQFLPGDQKKYGPIGGEAVTQERIHQLVDFIQSLQR